MIYASKNPQSTAWVAHYERTGQQERGRLATKTRAVLERPLLPLPKTERNK